MSSLHIYTSTSDTWSFIYYPSLDNSTIYYLLSDNGLIGNTKASILLLQQTL